MANNEILIHNHSICGIALVEDRTFDDCIGIAIKVFMKNQDITGKDLAEAIQISPASVSQITNGNISLTTDNMLKISSCLGISPTTLIDLAFSLLVYPMDLNSKWVKQ